MRKTFSPDDFIGNIENFQMRPMCIFGKKLFCCFTSNSDNPIFIAGKI